MHAGGRGDVDVNSTPHLARAILANTFSRLAQDCIVCVISKKSHPHRRIPHRTRDGHGHITFPLLHNTPSLPYPPNRGISCNPQQRVPFGHLAEQSPITVEDTLWTGGFPGSGLSLQLWRFTSCSLDPKSSFHVTRGCVFVCVCSCLGFFLWLLLDTTPQHCNEQRWTRTTPDDASASRRADCPGCER